MASNEWGVQQHDLALDDVFKVDGRNHANELSEYEAVIIGSNFGFPLDIAYEKIFIGGKTGSGKSYSAGVFMEELARHGIQFVCFDALDAHSGIDALPNVESISPKEEETVNLVKLVEKLKTGNSSLVINLINLRLDSQQKLIGDYCENLLAEDFAGKPVMTILEECQDFVPQMGKPESFAPIVRLCKLGRGKGLGATLISQRPAAIHKEALSQVSTYMVHNVINTKDLEALKNQLSFGTDKETIKKILSGISYAGPGEMVCFSPKYFKDVGYIKVGKVDRQRRTEHGGKNIEVTSKLVKEPDYLAYRGESISHNDVPQPNIDNGSNTFSDVKFNPLDEPDFDTPSYNIQAPTTNDDVRELEEYEWDPYGGETLYDSLEEIKSEDKKGMKAVTAIGLFTTGFYLLTRGLTRNKK